MMGHYNSDFDERKYWAYGCHCFMLGDRPMAEMGIGKPIDALDSACKAWKECQRCARMKHNRSASHPQGEFECLGEFTRYNFGLITMTINAKTQLVHVAVFFVNVILLLPK